MIRVSSSLEAAVVGSVSRTQTRPRLPCISADGALRDESRGRDIHNIGSTDMWIDHDGISTFGDFSTERLG